MSWHHSRYKTLEDPFNQQIINMQQASSKLMRAHWNMIYLIFFCEALFDAGSCWFIKYSALDGQAFVPCLKLRKKLEDPDKSSLAMKGEVVASEGILGSSTGWCGALTRAPPAKTPAKRTLTKRCTLNFEQFIDDSCWSCWCFLQDVMKKIGILDIYGFEVFDWNSFESLGEIKSKFSSRSWVTGCGWRITFWHKAALHQLCQREVAAAFQFSHDPLAAFSFLVFLCQSFLVMLFVLFFFLPWNSRILIIPIFEWKNWHLPNGWSEVYDGTTSVYRGRHLLESYRVDARHASTWRQSRLIWCFGFRKMDEATWLRQDNREIIDSLEKKPFLGSQVLFWSWILEGEA